jgi:hypothetical protein
MEVVMPVIKFPGVRPPPSAVQPAPAAQTEAAPGGLDNKVLIGAISIVWAVTVLTWPLLKWVVAMDVTFQFFRMLYYWNTPGTYAGFKFLLHFFAFSGLMYFVATFKPRWL